MADKPSQDTPLGKWLLNVKGDAAFVEKGYELGYRTVEAISEAIIDKIALACGEGKVSEGAIAELKVALKRYKQGDLGPIPVAPKIPDNQELDLSFSTFSMDGVDYKLPQPPNEPPGGGKDVFQAVRSGPYGVDRRGPEHEVDVWLYFGKSIRD